MHLPGTSQENFVRTQNYEHPRACCASAFTSFCVPQFDVAIVGSAEELGSTVVKVDVSHALLVTQVRLHTASLVVHLPDLDLRVHGAGQQEVGRARKPADRRQTLAVACPCVDVFFRDKTPENICTIRRTHRIKWLSFVRAMYELGGRLGRLQVDANILRNVQEGATLVVVRVFD